MNQQELTTLIHFNFWANEQILAACEQLTSEQFVGELNPNPGWNSLRDILVHSLDTEYGWRATMQDVEDIVLKSADFPTVAPLKARWQIEKKAWFDYVASLNEQTINQPYGENTPTVWQTVLHVITHSVQHRSEAAFILTGYGHSPGELDFAVFLRTQRTPSNSSTTN